MSRSYVQRFPVPPWRYRSQRGRGYVAHRWFYRTLLGGLGRSWRTFCLIFSLSFFYFEFLSILSRFRRGFGRVLGRQNGKKIEIFCVFWDMHLETLFFVNFCVIFVKNDGETHMEFCLFFHILFYYLFAQFAVSLNARNQKNQNFLQGKFIFL